MLDLTDWEKKKYQTKDGRPVRLLCVDAIGGWPVVGLLYDSYDGRQYPLVWRADGSYSSIIGSAHEADLINAKTKKEGWVNVYKEGSISYYLKMTKQEADDDADKNRVACVKIEWEE